MGRLEKHIRYELSWYCRLMGFDLDHTSSNSFAVAQLSFIPSLSLSLSVLIPDTVLCRSGLPLVDTSHGLLTFLICSPRLYNASYIQCSSFYSNLFVGFILCVGHLTRGSCPTVHVYRTDQQHNAECLHL